MVDTDNTLRDRHHHDHDSDDDDHDANDNDDVFDDESTRRRGMMDMNRRIGDSSIRSSTTSSSVLHDAGGESTNSVFWTSFAILFVMILFFAFTGNNNDSDKAATVPQTPTTATTTKSFSYTDNAKHPEWHRQVQPRATNINLVIIGNATAHYNYLSLVYYLRWGRWFEPSLEKSNLVNEESFDNPFHDKLFGEFHYQTNVLLEPYELCDCHRSSSKQRKHLRSAMYENRYYHDPNHNNTVTYIHAWGDETSLQGRLDPNELYNDRWSWSTKEKGLLNPGWDQPKWKYDTWVELIQDYISNIDPKPQFVVMEAGGFNNTFGPGKGAKVAQDIVAALEGEDIHSFWRTKSYDQLHSLLPDGVEAFDQYMCGVMRDCLDMTWTQDIRSELYWEQNFFHEPVHRVFNEELLEVMGRLPEGYEKYNRTMLF